MKEATPKVLIKNRKASFEFELLQEFSAGMVLTGTEIKSIRNGKANIADAYCTFITNELYVRNMHIEEYAQGNIYNHEPKRDRKLILHRSELNKLQTKLKDKGLTIIPLQLFISDKGYAKLDIALARGKKLYDKRSALKEKQLTRDRNRGSEDY
ncbi:MAG: SsrA-binding protein SmpB [Bacteroidia bacterium]|jgi:SsrA-binding protein